MLSNSSLNRQDGDNILRGGGGEDFEKGNSKEEQERMRSRRVRVGEGNLVGGRLGCEQGEENCREICYTFSVNNC